MDENSVAYGIIGAAIEVHRLMGPGLLESVYHQCLAREMRLRNIAFTDEVPLKAAYKSIGFDTAYRLDMLVQDKVIVELKVVDALLDVHRAQLLSYLRLSGKKLGLLINFNVSILKSGICRVVNGL
jgi:GxxExxY protein